VPESRRLFLGIGFLGAGWLGIGRLEIGWPGIGWPGIGFPGIGCVHGLKRQSRKKNPISFSGAPAIQTGQDRTVLCGPGRSEVRHPRGGRLRPGDGPMQCLIQAVTVVFTVIFAAEFAVSPELKCTDFSTAIQATHSVPKVLSV
jgi:hypothetical protein